MLVTNLAAVRIKNGVLEAPEWLRRLSVRLLISAQVMVPGSWDGALHWDPHWAWSLLKILSLGGVPGWLSQLSARLWLRS